MVMTSDISLGKRIRFDDEKNISVTSETVFLSSFFVLSIVTSETKGLKDFAEGNVRNQGMLQILIIAEKILLFFWWVWHDFLGYFLTSLIFFQLIFIENFQEIS